MPKNTAVLLAILWASLSLYPRIVSSQDRHITEQEPNDSISQANAMSIGDTAFGVLDPACDVDTYGLDVSAGTRLSLHVHYVGYIKVLVKSADSVLSFFTTDGAPDWNVPILTGGHYYIQVTPDSPEGPPADCSYRSPGHTYALYVTAQPEQIGPGDPTSAAFPDLQGTVARLGVGRSNELWAYTDRGVVAQINQDGSLKVIVQSLSSMDHDGPDGAPYVTDGYGNVLITGDTGRGEWAPVMWQVSPATRDVTVSSRPFWPPRYRFAVAANGDIWLGPAARMGGPMAGSSYIWRFSPLGEVLDTVPVPGTPDDFGAAAAAISPSGALCVSGVGGVYRVVDGALQLMIPRGSDSFGGLAFDRDGYLYAVKQNRNDGNQRVALYDPSFRLLNDTLAHLPYGGGYQLLFAPGRDGGLTRLLALSYQGLHTKFVEVNSVGIRAPGFAFPGLLAIDHGRDSTARIGLSFSMTLRMIDAPEPVHWSVAAGIVPPGMMLSETTGELSGVPHHLGTYVFSVRAQSGNRFGYDRVTVVVADLPFTIADVANSLLGGPALSAADAQFVDHHGIRNGILDAGDLRALLRARALLPQSPPNASQP